MITIKDIMKIIYDTWFECYYHEKTLESVKMCIESAKIIKGGEYH